MLTGYRSAISFNYVMFPLMYISSEISLFRIIKSSGDTDDKIKCQSLTSLWTRTCHLTERASKVPLVHCKVELVHIQ